jgi:N-acetylneuraminic acid mutarotase
MPVPISNYNIAVLKDSTGTGLYVFGGRDQDGAIIDTVQVYYPATNKAMVVKKDNWPGKTPSDCVSLPGTGVSVVDNKAYVVGGMSFSTSIPSCVDDNSAQVWSFDPMAKSGKKWKKGPSLNTARGYVATAVIGDTIYAIGGDVNDGAGTLVADPTTESWKVGSASWKTLKAMPEGCDESQAFAYASGPLANTVTIAGCGQWPNALADVLQYDTKKNQWANVGSLAEARRNQAGVDIGTDKAPKMMVVGGYNLDGTVILSTSEVGSPASAPGAVRGIGGGSSLIHGHAATF